MPKYEMTGAIRLIHDTQTFASGFAKREFVVETGDKYPQLIKLQVIKDKTAQLDNLRVNDVVNVSFNISGSEYKERHYVNLVAWKVEATGETAEPSQASRPGRDVSAQEATRKMHGSEARTAAQPDDETDDIPF
jgi:hypothetical protein